MFKNGDFELKTIEFSQTHSEIYDYFIEKSQQNKKINLDLQFY